MELSKFKEYIKNPTLLPDYIQIEDGYRDIRLGKVILTSPYDITLQFRLTSGVRVNKVYSLDRISAISIGFIVGGDYYPLD